MPYVTHAGIVGLVMLLGPVLYWVVGLHWLPPQHDPSGSRRRKLSLVLVPLVFALGYVLLSADPADRNPSFRHHGRTSRAE